MNYNDFLNQTAENGKVLITWEFFNLSKIFNCYYLMLTNSYTEYPIGNILPPFISTTFLTSSRGNLFINTLTCWRDSSSLEGWVILLYSITHYFPQIYQPIWSKIILCNASVHKGGILSRGSSGKWSCVVLRLHQSESKVLHFVPSAIVLCFSSVSLIQAFLMSKLPLWGWKPLSASLLCDTSLWSVVLAKVRLTFS